MQDDKNKPELSILGESSEMSEDEIIESLMSFIESKMEDE